MAALRSFVFLVSLGLIVAAAPPYAGRRFDDLFESLMTHYRNDAAYISKLLHGAQRVEILGRGAYVLLDENDFLGIDIETYTLITVSSPSKSLQRKFQKPFKPLSTRIDVEKDFDRTFNQKLIRDDPNMKLKFEAEFMDEPIHSAGVAFSGSNVEVSHPQRVEHLQSERPMKTQTTQKLADKEKRIKFHGLYEKYQQEKEKQAKYERELARLENLLRVLEQEAKMKQDKVEEMYKLEKIETDEEVENIPEDPLQRDLDNYMARLKRSIRQGIARKAGQFIAESDAAPVKKVPITEEAADEDVTVEIEN